MEMSNTIDTAMIAVSLDRIEVLVSGVLADRIARSKAQPILTRDFAELRALLGLDTPTARTGTAPFGDGGEAANVARKVRKMQTDARPQVSSLPPGTSE
jgi:hypothetical protein